MADELMTKYSIPVWLWDGEMEYEGEVVRARGRVVMARLARAGLNASGKPITGRRAAISPIEFQRRLVDKRCLLHFRSLGEGILLEAEVDGAQRCSVPNRDLLVQLRVVSDELEHERVLRSIVDFFTSTRVRLRAG